MCSYESVVTLYTCLVCEAELMLALLGFGMPDRHHDVVTVVGSLFRGVWWLLCFSACTLGAWVALLL